MEEPEALKARQRVFYTALGLILAGGLGALLLFSGSRSAPPSSPSAPAATEKQAPSQAVHILFIGNSYTAHNDLPKMLERIAASVPGSPYRLAAQSVTGDSANLAQWAAEPELLTTLGQGGFDYVVLQEQSTTPLYTREIKASLAAFVTLARYAATGKARTVLFGTWARRKGDAFYQQGSTRDYLQPTSPEMMTQHIDKHYRAAVGLTGANYAGIGQYWQVAQDFAPEISLYAKDGSHPSIHGTYLTALVFYRYFSGHKPTDVTWAPQGVTTAQAQKLKYIAAQ